MISFVKKHTCLLFLIYSIILQTVSSRWIVAWLEIPSFLSSIVALLQYCPFLLFIVWKLFRVFKEHHINMFSITYYIFALYYSVLFVVRILGGTEAKESLYYSIILFGSIALFSLVKNNYTGENAASLTKDICIFSLFLILYRLIHVIFLKQHVYYSPINEIAIGGSIVILLPVVIKQLIESEKSKLWSWLCTLIIFSFMAIVATLKSRVTFVIMLFEIVIVFLITIKKRTICYKFVGALGCAVVLITVLFALDVGEVRYSIYRETNIWSNSTSNAVVDDSNDSPQTPTPVVDDSNDSPQTSSPFTDDSTQTPEPVTNDSSQIQQATDQVENSDSMRAYLMQMSIENIKANPLFGTGDVLYNYETSGHMFKAPAHNFILITMNCYGLTGLLLIAILVIFMLFEIKFFQFNIKEKRHVRLLLGLTLIIYFGMGLVQATVYDILIMPLMFIIIATFTLSIKSDCCGKE